MCHVVIVGRYKYKWLRRDSLHVCNKFLLLSYILWTQQKSFLDKDKRNTIYFWYCPSKTEWPRHKLVNDQVKAAVNTPTLSNRCSYLFSKKKEYNNILKEWQTSFATSQKKSQLFLDFEDEEEHIIKPTYAKGGSWLSYIRFTNSLCAQFTHMITGHTCWN